MLSAEGWIHTAPAAFLPSEEITVYFHVCTSDMEDDASLKTVYGGFNEGELISLGEAILSEDDQNIWTFSLIPADAFSAEDIESLSFQIKNTDGSVELPIMTVNVFDFSVADNQMTTVFPASPNYAENMSIVFNATLSDRDDLTDVSPIFLWAWNNAESLGDAAEQGSWASINAETTVLTEVAPNIWRKDFIPQKYWDTEVPMTEIGLLFRNQTGTTQTEDMTIKLYPPPSCGGVSALYSFPKKFMQEDILTIVFDTKLESNGAFNGYTGDLFLETSLNGGEHELFPGMWTNYSLSELEKVKMLNEGNGVYTLTLYPKNFYEVTDPAFIIEQFNIVVRNKNGLKKSGDYTIKPVK